MKENVRNVQPDFSNGNKAWNYLNNCGAICIYQTESSAAGSWGTSLRAPDLPMETCILVGIAHLPPCIQLWEGQGTWESFRLGHSDPQGESVLSSRFDYKTAAINSSNNPCHDWRVGGDFRLQTRNRYPLRPFFLLFYVGKTINTHCRWLRGTQLWYRDNVPTLKCFKLMLMRKMYWPYFKCIHLFPHLKVTKWRERICFSLHSY